MGSKAHMKIEIRPYVRGATTRSEDRVNHKKSVAGPYENLSFGRQSRNNVSSVTKFQYFRLYSTVLKEK